MIETDVTIVGLGPTGATLAGLLGSSGLSVTVIDKLDDLYPHPRAAGIDHEALRILQRLGLGDTMREHIEPYRTSEYLGQSGSVIKRISPAPPPYPLGWMPSNVFDQPYMERMVRARLGEFDNVQVLLNTEVREVVDAGTHVTTSAVDMVGGQETTVTSQYVIACDGGSSSIRRSLGIELEDHGFHEPWLVVDAEVSAEVADRLPATQVQYCEPSRPTTFVVLVGMLRRWEIRLNDDELPMGEALPDERIWPYLQRWIAPNKAKIKRSAAYTFHGLTAQEWKKGRILLAGDAAHMTPPFMAQGMVQGMRDADNLAWKLRAVIKDEASPNLLDTYQEERRPHVHETTDRAIELGTIIGERDAQAAQVRDDRLQSESEGGTLTVVRQDMIPSLEQGFIYQGSNGAGTLLPQPYVNDVGGTRTLLDDVTSRGFNIVTTSDPTAEISSAAEELNAQIVVLRNKDDATRGTSGRGLEVTEDARLLTSWFETRGVTFALVRPDKYVYGTADSPLQAVQLIKSAVARL